MLNYAQSVLDSFYRKIFLSSTLGPDGLWSPVIYHSRLQTLKICGTLLTKYGFSWNPCKVNVYIWGASTK